MLFDNIIYEDLNEHLRKHHRDVIEPRTILMEESAELIEALARTYRPDRDVGIENVAEEMAHVFITMELVAPWFGATPEMIQEAVDKKRRKHGLVE